MARYAVHPVNRLKNDISGLRSNEAQNIRLLLFPKYPRPEGPAVPGVTVPMSARLSAYRRERSHGVKQKGKGRISLCAGQAIDARRATAVPKRLEPRDAAGRPAGESSDAPIRMAQRPFCKFCLSDGHAVGLPEIFVFKSDDDVSAIVCRADHASRSGNLNHDITLFCFCFPGFYFGYGIAMGGGAFETLRFDNTLRRRRLPPCTCDDLTRLHDRERR